MWKFGSDPTIELIKAYQNIKAVCVCLSFGNMETVELGSNPVLGIYENIINLYGSQYGALFCCRYFQSQQAHIKST